MGTKRTCNLAAVPMASAKTTSFRAFIHSLTMNLYRQSWLIGWLAAFADNPPPLWAVHYLPPAMAGAPAIPAAPIAPPRPSPPPPPEPPLIQWPASRWNFINKNQ